MSIPKLRKDLAVIQKLSDLPNSLDGLSAAELKAKFDEAALSIQEWINQSLVPALKAENLPFTASEQIRAEDVQTAIEQVFAQIRDASSGTIANGSVTKEKLASALLERIFGGSMWVSLDKPSAEHNPTTEFPVGQLWLRPGFTVENGADDNWSATACTVDVGDQQVVITGNQTVAMAQAELSLTDMGEDGDRVYVLFDIKNKDSEITNLTVCLNDGEEKSTAQTVHTGVLIGGAMSVRFRALWPSTSLAKGSFTVANLAVVNIDRIMRQTSACREFDDWGNYLKGLLPIVGSCYSPRELYVQTSAGVWKQLDHEIFPVERGGTGLDAVGKGEILVGGGGSVLEKVPAPAEEASILQFLAGMPRWQTGESVLRSAGALCITTGGYTGTGTGRTLTLPVMPFLLCIYPKDGPATDSSTIWDNPIVVPTGGKYCEKIGSYIQSVELAGYTVVFSGSTSGLQKMELGNRKDLEYQWVAIY